MLWEICQEQENNLRWKSIEYIWYYIAYTTLTLKGYYMINLTWSS